MKSKTKVVVVGGGVVGVSVLYHLAKKGWSDVALVERKELLISFYIFNSFNFSSRHYIYSSE